jgi:hypothetical protein
MFPVFIFFGYIANEFKRPLSRAKPGIDENERLTYPENLQWLVAHSCRDISVEGIIDLTPFIVQVEFHIGIKLYKILRTKEEYPLVSVWVDVGSHANLVFRFVDIGESQHQLRARDIPLSPRADHRHSNALVYGFPRFKLDQIRLVP